MVATIEKKEKRSEPISTRLTTETFQRLESFAQDKGTTNSNAIAALVEAALTGKVEDRKVLFIELKGEDKLTVSYGEKTHGLDCPVSVKYVIKALAVTTYPTDNGTVYELQKDKVSVISKVMIALGVSKDAVLDLLTELI